MPSSASAESFTQAHLIYFFLHLQQWETSLSRTPLAGTVTPWLWEWYAWIRPRTLQTWDLGTEINYWYTWVSIPFARQKVRLLEGPWTQWPMDGLLLHHYDLGSDVSHVSMLWAMLSLLSVIPSWQFSRFRSSQSRAAKTGLLSLILTLMAGASFLTFGFTEAVHATPAKQDFMVSPAHGTVPRIWAVQSSPRSPDMFGHRLFRIVESLHTALDSSTATDYPNSHKLVLMEWPRAPEIHWQFVCPWWLTSLPLLKALNFTHCRWPKVLRLWWPFGALRERDVNREH